MRGQGELMRRSRFFIATKNAHQPGVLMRPWGISTLGDLKMQLVGVCG